MTISPITQTGETAAPAGGSAEPGESPPDDAQAAGAGKWRRVRRRIALVAVVAALSGSTVALGLWANNHSQYVLSRNALVRGELTEVGTRRNGVLVSIEVRDGERVTAGQTLARLYDRDLRSQEIEVQAQIEALEREVELERTTTAHERLKRDVQLQESVAKAQAASAEVAAAQSRASEAHAFYQVRLSLLESNMISPAAVRESEARYATAQALLDVARANEAAAQAVARAVRLDGVGVDLRNQRIEILKDNVRAAKARLEGTRADLESAAIRAPGDGAVIRWLVKSGGSVQVGTPVVSMSIGREAWIEAWIDEDEIHRVRIGSAATVTLPSHGGREFKGVVDTIGLTTDFEQPISAQPEPRFVRMRGAPMIGLRIRLLDAPDTLLPGLSASVAIRGEGS